MTSGERMIWAAVFAANWTGAGKQAGESCRLATEAVEAVRYMNRCGAGESNVRAMLDDMLSNGEDR